MLKMIFVGLLLAAAPAFAEPVGDGCYVVRRPEETMSGVVCISESKVLYLNTAGQVLWCDQVAGAAVDQQRTAYVFGASSEIVSVVFDGTRDFGKLTLIEAGKAPSLLTYSDYTLRLIDRIPRFFASPKCMNAR